MSIQIEEPKKIPFREIPGWLFSSKKVNDAILNNDLFISVNPDIVISPRESIKNNTEFENMIKCCDFFEYNILGQKYPLTLYAYYFLNNLDKCEKYKHLNFRNEFRSLSLIAYTILNSTPENSEQWDLIVKPAMDNISVICNDQMLMVINKNQELISIDLHKYQSKMKLLELYYSFYDFLESSFKYKGKEISNVLSTIKNIRYKRSYLQTFFRFFHLTITHIPPHNSEFIEYSKMIELFLSLYELNEMIIEELKPLGLEKYKRFFIDKIIENYRSVNEENRNLFMNSMSSFDLFLQHCGEIHNYFTPYDYYHSYHYWTFKELVVEHAISTENTNRKFNDEFNMMENSPFDKTPLFEQIFDFCAW